MYDKFERNQKILDIRRNKTPLVIEAQQKLLDHKERVENLRVGNSLHNKYKIPFSQRELAELGSFSFDTYNKAKNTRYGFNIEILVSIAVLFDVSLDWLILGEEKEFSIHDKIESVENVHLLEQLIEQQRGRITQYEEQVAELKDKLRRAEAELSQKRG